MIPLRAVLALEFRYQWRRPITWLYAVAIFVFAFLVVTENYTPDAREGYFLLNSPILVATVTVLSLVHWLPVGASVAADAATRDLQTRMYPLSFTAPVRKTSYLTGRFLAALAVNFLLLLSIPAGILLAIYASGVAPEIAGSFRLSAYGNAFFFLLLPNAFYATAIQFALAAISRKTMMAYLGGVLLFLMAYLFGLAMEHPGAWVQLADPMCFTTVMRHLSDWSPVDRNHRLLLLQDEVLINRLLWLGISVGLLAITYYRFRFVQPRDKSPKEVRADEPVAEEVAGMAGIAHQTSLPAPQVNFGIHTAFRQLGCITRRSFWQVAGNKAGLPLLVLLALVMLLAMPGNLKAKGVPLLPRTAVVLHMLTASLTELKAFWLIFYLLIIYYAGELVWKDREAGLADIAGAAPVSNAVWFLGRLMALCLVLLAWLLLLMLTGIVAQWQLGHEPVEFGLYLATLFGFQLPEGLLFIVLVLFLQVIAHQKVTGHLLAMGCFAAILFAPVLGIEHKLLIYSASPAWSYTDMAGFGQRVAPWLWFKLYWLAFGMLLSILAMLFWVRGRTDGWSSRFRLAGRRLRGTLGWLLALALMLLLAFGAVVFYQTNLLHPYSHSADRAAKQAAYELRYGRYRHAKQPTLQAVSLRVAIFPGQRAVDIQGTYLLKNHQSVPVDSIHITTGLLPAATQLRLESPYTEVLADPDLDYYIIALSSPVQPGDTVRLSFRISYKAVGFTNHGLATEIGENGSRWSNMEWLPAIGYQAYRELDAVGDRQQHGLIARPATPSLYDLAARNTAPFPEQIHLDAVISTDSGQQVIAPGSLRRSWIEHGRSYFHYATEAPIRNEYHVFSGSYAVQKDTLETDIEGAPPAVSLEVYYPKALGKNPGRMLEAAKASLRYYSREFGAYPYPQLRFVAHPGFYFGNHAAPINTSTEEGFFLLNPEKDPRGFDLVSATVAHEVAHQWWGNQLKAAGVEGAGLITESLAWYSAMGVLEEHYGEEALLRLLAFLREEQETPRSKAALPLLQANDFYQNYRKGPLALYTISQYIGRPKVNQALRHLLETHRPGNVPYATSLDLYQALQEVTPDSLQGLLHDLFEVNTFWDLSVEAATAQQLATDHWQVSIAVMANKKLVDSAGHETPVPMNDRVEMAVYTAVAKGEGKDRPARLQKRQLRSGRQTIILTVKGKPVSVAIDPRQLLIDWNTTDHHKKIVVAAGH